MMPIVPRSGSVHSRSSAARSAGVTVAAMLLSKLPVWILGMLQIPKRPATTHDGKFFEVVLRWRRTGSPFECPTVPWIISGRLAFEGRVHDVKRESPDRKNLEDHSYRRNQIVRLPSAPCGIRVDSTRHAEHACEVKRYEGHIEAYEKAPETELPKPLVIHPAAYLRIPVIHSREQPKHEAADKREMEVRNDEIGIVQLPVKGRHRKHNARKARYEELQKETTAVEHGRIQAQLAAVHGCRPIKDFDARRNTD